MLGIVVGGVKTGNAFGNGASDSWAAYGSGGRSFQ